MKKKRKKKELKLLNKWILKSIFARREYTLNLWNSNFLFFSTQYYVVIKQSSNLYNWTVFLFKLGVAA